MSNRAHADRFTSNQTHAVEALSLSTYELLNGLMQIGSLSYRTNADKYLSNRINADESQSAQ